MNPEIRSDHRQRGYRVRLEWGRPGVELLAAECAVVVIVDVLSFSTSVDIAVGRGARVLPQFYDDPAAAAAEADARGALRAGPRSGAGPSLRPASLRELPAGSTLALPSPNGATLCVVAADRGAVVLAGCLRNAAAVAAAAARHDAAHRRRAGVHESGFPVPTGHESGFPEPTGREPIGHEPGGVGAAAARFGGIGIVPGGERWPDGTMRVAVEDALGAGAIAARLAESVGGLSPEAELAAAQFTAARERGLHAVLAGTASGRELVTDGYGIDVELAAALDISATVPRLRDGVLAGDEARSR